MLTWNAAPPDPTAVRRRLARGVAASGWSRRRPWIEHWLAHQRRDAYWQHGSVCEDYAAIECPVYAVGGFADGYTNAVPRLLAGLSGPRKGLIGPWAHAFPDDASPGPSIGFLQESVRWFDHWLKGDRHGRDGRADAAGLDAGVGAAAAELRGAAGPLGCREPSWPSPNIGSRAWKLPLDEPRALLGVQSNGTEAGVWTAEGQSADLAGDQRPDDAVSLTFDSEPLAEPLEILGLPEATLELAVDRPVALVVVRLCDVFPDGTSALVTRGLLNLTHRAEPRESGGARARPPLRGAGAARPDGVLAPGRPPAAGRRLAYVLAVGLAVAGAGAPDALRRLGRPPGARAARRRTRSCPTSTSRSTPRRSR